MANEEARHGNLYLKKELLNKVSDVAELRRRAELKYKDVSEFEALQKSNYDLEMASLDPYLVELANHTSKPVGINDQITYPIDTAPKVDSEIVAAVKPRIDVAVNEILVSSDTSKYNAGRPFVLAIHLDNARIVYYGSPLYNLDGPTGDWLTFWTDYSHFNMRDMVLTGVTATYCSWELKRIQRAQGLSDSPPSSLALSLIKGEWPENNQLVQAKTKRVSLDQPHCVLAIDSRPEANTRIGISRFRYPALSTEFGSLSALIPSFSSQSRSEVVTSVDEYVETLKASGVEQLSVGIGTPVEKITDYQRSWREAVFALIRGKRVFGQGKVTHFDDLRTDRTAFYLGVDEIKRQLPDYLDSLLETDDNPPNGQLSNSKLIDLLTALRNCGWKYSKAGELLGVHGNTVDYQIKRIEDRLNISLSSWETRRELDFAIQMLDCLPDVEAAERLSDRNLLN